MKKIGITLSGFVLVFTLLSFRSAPIQTNSMGLSNRVSLSIGGQVTSDPTANLGRAAFAVGRYAIQVTRAYTPLVDDAVRTFGWLGVAVLKEGIKDYNTKSKKAKMASLG
jgi:hypothetical protein